MLPKIFLKPNAFMWLFTLELSNWNRQDLLEKRNSSVRHHLKMWAGAWISVNDLCEHLGSSEYTLGRQWRPCCSRNMDMRSSSAIRLEVLNLYNVVSCCPEKLEAYFHIPLVLLANWNKKVLSLLMDIFPLNNCPNFLRNLRMQQEIHQYSTYNTCTVF